MMSPKWGSHQNKDYLLPDYITKIETKFDESKDESMVGTIYNNCLENEEYMVEAKFYLGYVHYPRSIYSDMEKYVKEMKKLLSLETSFDGTESEIYDYRISEKQKIKQI